jgi:hypothetical protein
MPERDPEPPNADYERGIGNLIKVVVRVHDASAGKWSPTPLRHEISEIAIKLDKIADLLGHQGSAQRRIESVHDEPEARQIGLDGYPIEESPLNTKAGSYQETTWRIRWLADSAREAANRLPNPRQKRALPYAAMGLLHLRQRYDFPRPALSNNSEEVNELDRICRAAGIFLSRERLRGALAQALKEFDGYVRPGYEWISELFK